MPKKVNTADELVKNLEPGGMIVTRKGLIGFIDPAATGELSLITTRHVRSLRPAELFADGHGPVEVFSRAEVEELANEK